MIAVAGVDMAAWDALARAAGVPRAPAVLIARCRGCDQIELDFAELSGLQTWAAVRDYCDRLVCPRCGRQEIDVRTERQ
jgi:hypothetical protein